MLSIVGQSNRVCDGTTRREVLRAAGLGLFGLSLPRVLADELRSPTGEQPRAKSVIFLFLFGGPSQLETFDLKPDAPSKIRGPFKPIASRTPGLRISEHLPRLASVSDKFCVVRTMTHSYNDHSGAGHYMQTGRRWHVPIGGGFDATPKDWPSMGSVVEYFTQHGADTTRRDLPGYAVVPARLGHLEQAGQYLRPGEYAGWLGRAYNPLATRIDKKDLKDNPYWRDCNDEELTFRIAGLDATPGLELDRIGARGSLLEQLDTARRALESRKTVEAFDRFQQRAYSLVTSERTRIAFDIRTETSGMRDQYGRHLFGQSTLMARRLVEAGVRFVTVHYDAVDGYSWDSHLNSRDVEKHLLPTFDQALAALLTDLDERGLLDETLVVALGEMGRTPQANADWGRGHWSTLFPAVLAGGGIRRGAMVGNSDKDAALPIDHPVTPEDLAATIYYALGIDPSVRLPDAQGRPSQIVEQGRPVLELFG
jgi:hypothetical protein